MNQTEATTAGWPADEGKRNLTLLMELLAILSRYAHEDGAGGMYGEGAVETLDRLTNELDKRRCQTASDGDQTGQCAVHFRDDQCEITMHCVGNAGHPGEHHYHQMPGNNCVCRPVESDFGYCREVPLSSFQNPDGSEEVRNQLKEGWLIESLHGEEGGVSVYWNGISFTDRVETAVQYFRCEDAIRTLRGYGWKAGFAWALSRGKPRGGEDHRRTGDLPTDQPDAAEDGLRSAITDSDWSKWWKSRRGE